MVNILKMSNYQETVEWLYSQIPQFQRIGAGAYKPGLGTSRCLDDLFGNPHRDYPVIHVGGTNGKGSTSHTLAAILAAAGFKVGLYTSPHLVDFRERIRINGEMISHEYVTDFVDRYRALGVACEPSFFELTSTMAFRYFADNKVDIAVIEVGLGGRLDSTNIVMPVLSVITNISLDHTAFLGDTEPEIAREKAGIIKPGVPVVIGEAAGAVRGVFEEKAREVGAPITFAEDDAPIQGYTSDDDAITYDTRDYGRLTSELTGDCQPHNAATILTAVSELRKAGVRIPDDAVRQGFASVVRMTGLTGRWMTVRRDPLTVCDTGHNIGGWRYIAPRLRKIAASGRPLHIILGFVSDKDFGHIVELLPGDATIYYTQADIPRALDCNILAAAAAAAGHPGRAYAHVSDAWQAALAACAGVPDAMVFVGGSTFVVADFLAMNNG